MPACSPLRPRSADRLGALVSDWLGMRVEVIEFAGAWLPLPPDQRSRIWRPHGAVVAASASMPRPACAPGTRRRASSCASGRWTVPGFERLLPDRLALHRLVSLVRAYRRLRDSASPSIPCWRRDRCRRCGWTRPPIRRRGWAGTPGCPALRAASARARDAADAVFEAEMIEAQHVDWRGKERAA